MTQHVGLHRRVLNDCSLLWIFLQLSFIQPILRLARDLNREGVQRKSERPHSLTTWSSQCSGEDKPKTRRNALHPPRCARSGLSPREPWKGMRRCLALRASVVPRCWGRWPMWCCSAHAESANGSKISSFKNRSVCEPRYYSNTFFKEFNQKIKVNSKKSGK